MKKWVAGFLAVMLCLGMASALGAESSDIDDALVVDNVSFAYNMEMIEGIPYGYGVPEGWTEIALSEDEIAWGGIGRWQNPEGTITLDVTLEELTEAVTVKELAEMMEGWKNYTGVGLLTINGRAFIGYEKVKEGTYGMTTMIPQEGEAKPLLVDFDFTFSTPDEASAQMGVEIISLFSEVVAEGLETAEGTGE